jgi:hypothetical protein
MSQKEIEWILFKLLLLDRINRINRMNRIFSRFPEETVKISIRLPVEFGNLLIEV